MDPIPSLNLMNIGIQVDGKNYDPAKSFDIVSRKGMYGIDSLQNRDEAFRTVFVWDCSKSMAGRPWQDAKTAIQKYIQIKRPSDQVAIIAIRDTQDGYQLVSNFEKDYTLLYQRIDDVVCDGQKTRLYDSIVAAVQLCTVASQGSINNTAPEFAILNVIVALSDGHDEGSAISRDVLITRLSSLNPPVPIYSLAYSSTQERQHFLNMEAMSKATFGRYWSLEDSQNYASTLQKIHHINRSDYVVTFRVPESLQPDGAKHNFAIGIQYPSNSARFLYRQGEFTAMESPAAIMGGRPKEIWERLTSNYVVPQAPPMPPSGVVALATESPDPTGEVPPVAVVQMPAFETKDIIMLGAIGAAILFMIIAIVLWVRSNSMAKAHASSGTSTNPPGSRL
jgi:hypothetical protein